MTALIEVNEAVVEFPRTTARLFRKSQSFRALNGVSIQVDRGGSLGIVGESGSGKSTLVRAIVGLTPLEGGRIVFEGKELPIRRRPEVRRRMQMVFQDPGSSLNPSLTVGRVLLELLKSEFHTRAGRLNRAGELMELVGLAPNMLESKPRQLSGGQRQRVALARALATKPDVLIADEPTSSLDVSVQAVILNLLRELKKSLDLTVILVSHDLGVVRNLCQDITVMRHGAVVESGRAADVFTNPQHAYSRQLLQSSPDLGALQKELRSSRRTV